MLEYKLCPDCNQEYPATTEFFAPFKKNKNGLFTYCRKCAAIRTAKYRDANRDEVRRKDRETRRANREHYTKLYLEWRNRHLEAARAYARRHYTENREHYREYSRGHYAKHRERLIKKRRETTNRDHENTVKRDYHKRNPHKNRQWLHTRRARKLALPAQFTDQDWQTALDYWHGCCAYCGVQQDFWHGIEADHYIPLTAINCPGTVPKNMLPACKSCNASKHNNDPLEWLISHFGEKRAKLILKRIEDYFVGIRT